MHVVDSHTAGEPTRVVVEGGPDLGVGDMAERRELFREQFDHWRRLVVCEPRGSDVLVGALLCSPATPSAAAGAIYFNNVGYLGMCGHASIGLAVTLGHLGRLAAGRHAIETPVGTITLDYDGAHRAAFENVASYRTAADVALTVDGVGQVVGDVAWGGNWFFLVRQPHLPLQLDNVARLTDAALRIRDALARQGIVGRDGAPVDHVEFFGPAGNVANNSRNFVLCPGGVYDRSPCGTGLSAKIACLAADGQLRPGQIWRQEGILGSVFEGSYRMEDGQIIPRIAGDAYVTAEATLLVDPQDPWRPGEPWPGAAD
ncbi:MAG: proline racemase family protein [Planctomycetales bacterium]|nr:proline racemase family protein [Planctomycetales bacterium]